MYFPCKNKDSGSCLFKVGDEPVYKINASLTAICESHHFIICQDSWNLNPR